MTDKIVNFTIGNNPEENNQNGNNKNDDQYKNQIIRLTKENQSIRLALKGTEIKLMESELNTKKIEFELDRVIIEFRDYREETEKRMSEIMVLNDEIMSKNQALQVEKEAAFLYIEANEPDHRKFNLREWMLTFPDRAKFVLLAIFGIGVAITAAILGKPQGQMAREKDPREDHRLSDRQQDHGSLKSYDLNKNTEMVGESEGTKIIPVPISPIRVPDIKDP